MTDRNIGALNALDIPVRQPVSIYPEPFRTQMEGREKRVLGNIFGLNGFGVNLTRLRPGGVSALRHWHSREDEFIYILSGHPTLITDAGETQMSPGMCAGFKGGVADAHRLENRSEAEVLYLEVGDRIEGDETTYPDDDIEAHKVNGAWVFSHKDGSPY